MNRLHSRMLASLPAAVARPQYLRADLRPGIVHLGVGAFQRAHLAAVNEAALEAGGDLHWGIAGVSLRSPETRDALEPQQGLYTLVLRDADASGTPHAVFRVMGCLLEVLVAPESPAAVLERIADPATRIVSLTITEKGYCHNPSTGRLRSDHPDVLHDLAHPAEPRAAIGFLVRGLALRRARGLDALTLLSLDNLPSNGHLLRGLVLGFAERVDVGLAAWIDAVCTFPCSMVDRIVPRTTAADRTAVAAALGVEDAWPVVGENFLEWVIEDDFAAGRPDWDAGGARFVADARPFETLKLRMVNGAHSALAYLGALSGLDTVDRAVAEPALHAYLDALLREDIAPTLPALPGLDLDAYRRALLRRFANPALAHRTAQIAMDGSQKLPQRLLGTIRDQLAAGAPIARLVLAVAGWLHYLGGVDELGRHHTIEDPMAAALAQCRQAAEQAAAEAGPAGADEARAAVFTGFAPVFGEDLGRNPRFVAALAQSLRLLRECGVRGALDALR